MTNYWFYPEQVISTGVGMRERLPREQAQARDFLGKRSKPMDSEEAGPSK